VAAQILFDFFTAPSELAVVFTFNQTGLFLRKQTTHTSNQELPQEFHLGHMMLGKPTAMGLSAFDAQRI
jgi:hypothetical protein